MRRLCLLALCTALLPATTPAHAAPEEVFAWRGTLTTTGTLNNEPQQRDVTITFTSVRALSDGTVQESAGCVATGSELGTLVSAAGSAQLIGCESGPDIVGSLTWERTGTVVTFDGDFTCGNEPKRPQEEPCKLVVNPDGTFDFACLLVPDVVER